LSFFGASFLGCSFLPLPNVGMDIFIDLPSSFFSFFGASFLGCSLSSCLFFPSDPLTT